MSSRVAGGGGREGGGKGKDKEKDKEKQQKKKKVGEEIKQKHYTLPRNEFCTESRQSLCHGGSETSQNYFW